jgi:hypothetical protein
MAVVDCPIREEAEQTIELSRNFLKSLRKLRRSLRKCQSCPARQECKLLRGWNSQIEQAIDEVNEEWAVNDGS